jgi:hypothetical protein
MHYCYLLEVAVGEGFGRLAPAASVVCAALTHVHSLLPPLVSVENGNLDGRTINHNGPC